jgi:hypothetical protein
VPEYKLLGQLSSWVANSRLLCFPRIATCSRLWWSLQTLSLHLLVERARGASSFWAPFVARLPDQVQEHDHSYRPIGSRLLSSMSAIARSALQACTMLQGAMHGGAMCQPLRVRCYEGKAGPVKGIR